MSRAELAADLRRRAQSCRELESRCSGGPSDQRGWDVAAKYERQLDALTRAVKVEISSMEGAGESKWAGRKHSAARLRDAIANDDAIDWKAEAATMERQLDRCRDAKRAKADRLDALTKAVEAQIVGLVDKNREDRMARLDALIGLRSAIDAAKRDG